MAQISVHEQSAASRLGEGERGVDRCAGLPLADCRACDVNRFGRAAGAREQDRGANRPVSLGGYSKPAPADHHFSTRRLLARVEVDVCFARDISGSAGPGAIEIKEVGDHAKAGQSEMTFGLLWSFKTVVQVIQKERDPQAAEESQQYAERQTRHYPWARRRTRRFGPVDHRNVRSRDVRGYVNLLNSVNEALIQLLVGVNLAYQHCVLQGGIVQRHHLRLRLVDLLPQHFFARGRGLILRFNAADYSANLRGELSVGLVQPGF